jgi:hypothetical protein
MKTKHLLALLFVLFFSSPVWANKNDSMKAINQAEVLIESAERNGASMHAALLLKSSRDLLAKANAQIESRDWVDAEVSAKMAQRDAEVAGAKSLAMKAEKSYNDMRSAIDLLKSELARKRSQL